MELLTTDLDNTIIYSYRREIGAQRIPVEWYQGKMMSYMTTRAYQLLDQVQQHIHLIPVTTRSLEQYTRITFSTQPKWALAANGGILLINGQSDADWYHQSLAIVEPVEPVLRQAETCLANDPNRILDVQRINGLFVYTKSNQPEHTLDNLRAQIDETQVELMQNGLKVYVVPRGLDKGSAVQRLRKLLSPDRVFAAGDSIFDISLLQQAEIAFHPWTLPYQAKAGQCVYCMQPNMGVFSDYVLQWLNDYLV